MNPQIFTHPDGTEIEAKGSRSAAYLAVMATEAETSPEETDLEDTTEEDEEEAHESVE